MSRPRVGIWKSTLLPYSETFIRTQGESMSRYEASYFGLVSAGQLALPADRTYLLEEHSRLPQIAVRAFKVTGRSPALVDEMRRQRVGIVHAHFGTEAWRASWLSRRLGVPYVVTFHGADATTSDEVLRRTSASARQLVRYRREIFAGASKVIAVSSYIAGRLIESGCPAERVVVHEVGVDTDYFRPDPSVARTGSVLFVGRLVEKKGVGGLLEAMTTMSGPSNATPRLKIVGDGPQRAELEARARQLRLPVDFLGRRTHSEVRSLMQEAATLVVPSHEGNGGETEGLPTVIREAQACGLPVVVSDTAGANEAVEHEVSGMIVPARDTASLAFAISRVLNERALRDRLGAEGLKVAKAKDIGVQIESLELIYDAVLNESGGR